MGAQNDLGVRSATGPLSPRLNQRLLLKIISESTIDDVGLGFWAPDFSMCQHMAEVTDDGKEVNFQRQRLLQLCVWATDYCRGVRHKSPDTSCLQCHSRTSDGRRFPGHTAFDSCTRHSPLQTDPTIHCHRCSSVYKVNACSLGRGFLRSTTRLSVTRYVDIGPVGWCTVPEQFSTSTGHPDYVEPLVNENSEGAIDFAPESMMHPCCRSLNGELSADRIWEGMLSPLADAVARDLPIDDACRGSCRMGNIAVF